MKIFIGCDHRGVSLKKEIIANLKNENIEIFDTKLANSEFDDYPDFAFEVGENVLKNNALGVLICGNGIGVSIAANKVKGIRCARVFNTRDCIDAREHNDANIIAFGSDKTTLEAITLIKTFINSKTKTDIRHIKRVDKIIKYEDGEYNEL